MPGCTHERRRHALSIARPCSVILYMLAVGPPTSVMTPRKPSMRRSARTSRSTLSGGAALDDAALVLGDAAERAAAEAAAHRDDRVLHRLERRDRLARSAGAARARTAGRRARPSSPRVVERQRGRVEVDRLARRAAAGAAAPLCGLVSYWNARDIAAKRRLVGAPPPRTTGRTTTLPSVTCCSSGAARQRVGLVLHMRRGAAHVAELGDRLAGREPLARSPTTGRSPMPKTSRSALASSRIERRTESDQ